MFRNRESMFERLGSKPWVALFALLTAFLPGQLAADDTEIYFSRGPGTNADVARPNILFILDTSGSMSGSVDGTSDNRLEVMKSVMRDVITNVQDVNIGLMRFTNNEGGPVLFPISYVDDPVTAVVSESAGGGGGAGASDFVATVAANSDDAEEQLVAGTVDVGDDVLHLGETPAQAGGTQTLSMPVGAGADDSEEDDDGENDFTSDTLDLKDDEKLGVRFRAVQVPQGATIIEASITFTVKNKKTVSTDARITAHKTSNSAEFTNADDDISSRLSNDTAASIAWNNIPGANKNQSVTTPDLSAIVQELVDQPGWSAGNAMAFLFEGTRGDRQFCAFETDKNCNANRRPSLLIEYQTAGSPGSSQLVAVRFDNINIPQGATVNAATLTLTASADDASSANFTLSAEAADDAAALTSATGSLSARAKTSTTTWNNVVAWSTGDQVATPAGVDLVSVLQQVVNRPGWCGGNAITLFIQGSGTRRAVAFDAGAGGAPTLAYGYDPGSTLGCYRRSESSQALASSDDAEEAPGGDVEVNSTDLDFDNDYDRIGVRFPNLQVPQGATVLEAQLRLTANESDANSAQVRIRAEDTGNAQSFSGADDNISDRSRTNAEVTWDFSNWSDGEVYTSPDLTSVVQEVVDRVDWAAGNALALILEHVRGTRVAKSFEGSPAQAPVLQVTYQGSAGAAVKTVRQRLIEIVDALPASGNTPLVEVIDEAAAYWRGESVNYGLTRDSTRTARTSHPGSYCTAPLQCNGADTATYPSFGVYLPPGCPGRDSDDNDCRNERIFGSPTYISPFTEEADCVSNYQVVLTDGAANASGQGVVNDIQSMIGGSCLQQNGGGGNYTSNESCGVDVAKFLHDQDQSGSLANDQTVRTYTIAFNLNSPGASQFLMDMAAVGNGQERVPYDQDDPDSWSDGFYSATSAGALYEAFSDIIEDVRKDPTSIASPSLAANAFNRLLSRDEIYFGLFTPALETRWDGNLKRYRVCVDSNDGCTLGEVYDQNDRLAINAATGKFSDASQSYWSAEADGPSTVVGGAGAELTDYTTRTLYTDANTLGTAPLSGTSLDQATYTITANSWNSSANAAVRDRVCPTPSTDTGSECESLMLWMLGKVVTPDPDTDVNATTRWAFNDVLHSSPTVVTYGGVDNADPDDLDGDGNLSEPDGTVDAFFDKLLVGTNGGGLRMINAADGREDWTFMPESTLGNVPQLFNNPEADHIYGLDLTPVIYRKDVNLDGVIDPDDGDRVIVVIGMRRGGSNFYALDITPGATVTSAAATITPKFLWRIEGGGGVWGRLGQTWSKPKVAEVIVGGVLTPVLIFGGGYDPALDTGFGTLPTGGSPNTGNAVFVVNAETGARILAVAGGTAGGCDYESASGCQDATVTDIEVPGMVHSIAGEPSVFDADGNGTDDRIYVADTGGNVWRIDLGPTLDVGIPGGTVVGQLASLSDPATASAQRRFFESPAVASVNDGVLSSRSARYDYVVIGSGLRSGPLDMTVQDRFFALRDYYPNGMTDGDGDGIADGYPRGNANLPLGAIDLFDATSTTLNSDATAAGSAYGWYINLTAGEKVLSSPTILAGSALFTTYKPDEAASADVCSVNIGAGRAYSLKLLDASEAIDFLNNGPSTEDGNYIDERFMVVGGGIPSSVVPIFTKEGVVTIVGTEGGARQVGDPIDLPHYRTYWYEEQ